MRKNIIGLMAITIVMIAALTGCNKDVAAESATSEVTQEVAVDQAEEKVSFSTPDVSQPIQETLSEEEPAEEPIVEDDPIPMDEIVEDDPVPIVDSSSPVAKSVDWHDFVNGNTFNLDDYARALGYDVCFSEVDDRNGLSYYNIIKGGIQYSVGNSDFYMVVYYAEDDNHYCAADISHRILNSVDGIIIEAENQPADKVTEKWIDNVAGVLSYIATADSWVELDDLPVEPGHYVTLMEGPVYYDIDGTIYVDPLSKVVESHEN